MITFAVETWKVLEAEAQECFKLHYEEISADKDIPLAVNNKAFRVMEDAGLLHVVIARNEAGAIIGYCVALVHEHLHYMSLLAAYVDIYWVHPAARRVQGQLVGLRMMQTVEQTLKARGVRKIFAGTKRAHDASSMFEKLGWKAAETLYTKRLDGG